MTTFLSGRQRTGALCVQHSPTAAALSTKAPATLGYIAAVMTVAMHLSVALA